MNLLQDEGPSSSVAAGFVGRLLHDCFGTASPGAMDRYTDSPKVRRMYAATVEAFPDAALRRLWCVEQGDRVAVGGVVTATHRGEWRGLPATGRRIEVLTTLMFEVSDERVVDLMVVVDSLALAEQLGVAVAVGPKACELASPGARSNRTPCGDAQFGGRPARP